MPIGLPWTKAIIKRLAKKSSRDEFVADQLRQRIAALIRILREQRKLSQTEFGKLLQKPQSVVSRMENPSYGKVNLQTLLEVAHVFDLPLTVDMPNWPDWFKQLQKPMIPENLERTSFNEAVLLKSAEVMESWRALSAFEAESSPHNVYRLKDLHLCVDPVISARNLVSGTVVGDTNVITDEDVHVCRPVLHYTPLKKMSYGAIDNPAVKDFEKGGLSSLVTHRSISKSEQYDA